MKTGDLVMLKSGGPTMTVTRAWPARDDKQAVARCRWFHGGTKNTRCFPVDALTTVPFNLTEHVARYIETKARTEEARLKMEREGMGDEVKRPFYAAQRLEQKVGLELADFLARAM